MAAMPSIPVGIMMNVGTPDQAFAFSRLPNEGVGLARLEFIIKCYPGGRFSEFLDTSVGVGDELPLTGPFGVFTLRDSPAELVFVGGGAPASTASAIARSFPVGLEISHRRTNRSRRRWSNRSRRYVAPSRLRC